MPLTREAICEAVTRANMRFVETKTPEQQSCLMLHRTRHLFIRQQTSVINAIRAHLAEFGIVAPVGRKGVEELLDVVADPSDKRLPDVARACLAALGAHLRRLKEQILEFDRMIMAWHRSSEASKRLDAIPGVGPMLATALVASVADPKAFRSGRNFSAWIGLVPKQHSSGGKDRLGSISKQGDRYLRSLFMAGALAVIRYDPNTAIFKGQLDLDALGYIASADGVSTNVEGVFVAGDVNDLRYKQAVTAAGAGCRAAMDAEKYLEALEFPIEEAIA